MGVVDAETQLKLTIYAAETAAIVHILWGLVLILAMLVVALGIYVISIRKTSKRMSSTIMPNTAQSDDHRVEKLLSKVEELLGVAKEHEEAAETLKAEVRRADAIRTKAETRLKEQNTAMEGQARLIKSYRLSLIDLQRRLEDVATHPGDSAHVELPLEPQPTPAESGEKPRVKWAPPPKV